MSAAASATAGEPAIELRDLRKAFGSRPVLRGISMTIRAGETYTILGGSGSGKSVSIKHMIGLLRPDAGQVRVFGRDVSRLAERDWFEVRKHFGMVFQGAALFDSLNVYENVAYPLREHWQVEEREIRDQVRACLEAVGLAGIEELLPSELSGGMRKRVGVARAIALRPRVILYDEPTTGLDPANSRRIGRLIRDLQHRFEVTSVVVTHDMALCHDVSDRVALLRGGQIVLEASDAELRGMDHPELREFLEGSSEPNAPATHPGDPGAAGAP